MSQVLRLPASSTELRPFMVIWEVTRACDLACRHCRASAVSDVDPMALSTSEGHRLIDQIVSFGKPYPLLVLTGGDPFKRSDLCDLVAYAARQGLTPAVSPSATPLLTHDRLEALHRAGARAISLSLDGADAAVHDGFRGVDGTFMRTLDGARMAREIGLKLQINSTVSRHNLDQLDELAALVYELQAMTWSVFFLVPTGRAQARQSLTPAECEDVLHWLAEVGQALPLKATEAHHYKRVLQMRQALREAGRDPEEAAPDSPLYRHLRDRWRARGLEARQAARRIPMHINSADGFVFVSHLGEVMPSGFLPLSAGSVRRKSLVELYQESSLFQTLRNPDRLQGRCGLCEFRDVCGGSRSRAFAMTGNPLAEEPCCVYQPGSFSLQ